MQCDHSGTLAIGTCSPLFNHLHFLEGSTLVHTPITWPCLVSWGLFRCGCRALPCWQQALPLGCPSYNCIYSCMPPDLDAACGAGNFQFPVKQEHPRRQSLTSSAPCRFA